LQASGSGVRGAGIAAQQEDRAAVTGGGGAKAEDEVGPGHALRQGLTGEFAGPNKGHSIGDDEVRGGAAGAEVGVVAKAAKVVEVVRHDPATASGAELASDEVDALGLGQGVEPGVEQTDARDLVQVNEGGGHEALMVDGQYIPSAIDVVDLAALLCVNGPRFRCQESATGRSSIGNNVGRISAKNGLPIHHMFR